MTIGYMKDETNVWYQLGVTGIDIHTLPRDAWGTYSSAEAARKDAIRFAERFGLEFLGNLDRRRLFPGDPSQWEL